MGVRFNLEELKKLEKERQEKFKERQEKNRKQEEENTKEENTKEEEEKQEEENTKKENEVISGKKGIIKIENYIPGVFEFIIPSHKKNSFFKILPINFEDFDLGTVEKFSLCDGATLKCSQGDATSVLGVLPTKNIFVNDKPLAVISDTKPMVNIKPFGMCKSMANPTVAAATAANKGKLQKMPCVPNTVGPWTEGISHFLSDEMTPCDKSKCMCAYAGEISVQDPGQNILGTSVNNNSDKNKEKNDNKADKQMNFNDIDFNIEKKKKNIKKY